MIISDKNIRKLAEGDKIPYPLLLLADEEMDAINKYLINSELFVYEHNNEIIGIYVFHKNNENEIEIKNIAVDKKYQGLGIGRLLLKDAITRTKATNCKKIILGTWEFSHRLLRLYQSVGFEIYDRKRNYFIENYNKPIYEDGKMLKDMVMLKIDF